MGNANGKITAPVSLREDVAVVLGVSSGSLGYLAGNAHGKINMWSARKPIVHVSVGVLTSSDFKSVNYGLTIPHIKPSELPASKEEERGMFLWYYTPPGEANWKRLADFDGYNHNARHSISKIRAVNQRNGHKPVVVNVVSSIAEEYYAELLIDPYSDIPFLNYQVSADVGSMSELYLTLVIGTNMGTLSFPEAQIWQSENSLQEAADNGSYMLSVTANTADLVRNGVLISQKNIVFVYLAKKVTAANVFPAGISLKIDSSIETTFYNDSYAVRGDGGEGGYPVVVTVSYTIAWANNSVPFIQKGGVIEDTWSVSFDMLKVTFTGSQYAGSYNVIFYIVETGFIYVLTTGTTPVGGGNTQIILDTAITNITLTEDDIQDQNTGQPYAQITTRVYLESKTTGVIYSGNTLESKIMIPKY